MREIKFRAWETYEKKMYSIAFPTWNGCVEVWEKNKPQTNTILLGPGPAEPEGILMQFSGKKDKNSKDIYEGDWCSAMFRDRNGIQVIQGQIIMNEFMWCIDCTGCVGNDIFSINRPHEFEILGNIYENPELLNSDKNDEPSVATEAT